MLPRGVRSERGAELIELALVLPILLLVFAGIVDFGVVLHRFLTLNNAAREGARIAVLPGYQLADVQNRVTEYIREGIGDSTASPITTRVPVSIDPPGPTPPFPAYQVTVTLTHNYMFLGPVSGLLGNYSFSAITLTARSTMRIES